MNVSLGSAITTLAAPTSLAAPVALPTASAPKPPTPLSSPTPHTTNKQPLLSSTSFLSLQEESLPAAPSAKLKISTSQSDRAKEEDSTTSPSASETEEGDEKKADETSEEEGDEGELTEEEQRLVEQLQQRDAEVRRHEQAHASVGGQYAGAPQLEFTVGPDGRRYATGGEVSIDASKVPGDPEATIRKLQVVRRAALAPADPSPQDQRVAADASQGLNEARTELREIQVEERQEEAEEAAEAREQDDTGNIRPDASDDGQESDTDNPEGSTPNNLLQFNRDGVSSAQAADAFQQAARLTPQETNGAEVIEDTIRAVQITA